MATTGTAAETAPRATPSLWVGDLSHDVGETHLYHIFSAIAPVASIRVCRDQMTRRSLGYAYVNFHTAEQAHAAMKALNYEEINGKRCRIMWSQRDPSKRKSGLGNIFIKNLVPEADTKALYETFSMFGNILSCKVATEPDTGKSKCYGYVQFEKDEDAQKAIDKVDGMEMEGQKVSVQRYVRRSDRRANDSWTNCYVKNIPREWDEAKLTELFGKHGEITSLVIMRNPAGESRGFGFVNFATKEQAETAREALTGYVEPEAGEESKADDELTDEEKAAREARALYVARAQKRSERRRELLAKFREQQSDPSKFQGTNLYVKNLADDVKDEDLVKGFEKFGSITSARVMIDSEGASRGFGFVCFSTAEEATRAVNEMNKNLWHGRPLYVALAQRKEIRERQLKEEMDARMAQQSGLHRLGMPAPFPMPMMGQMAGPGFAPPGQGYMQNPAMGYAGPMMGPRGGYSGAPAGMHGGGRGAPRMRGGRGGGRGGYYGGAGGGRGPPSHHMHGPPMGVPHPAAAAAAAASSAPPPDAEAAAAAPAAESWTTALAGASPEQRMNILGERLYPLIAEKEPVRAGKITGMLLDLDTSEILILIESREQLDAKIREAVSVLQAHEATAPAQ